MLVVAALLVLAFANIAVRSSWSEVEDGVLWVSRPEGVVAAEIDIQSAAGTVGILPGDLLLAINGCLLYTSPSPRDLSTSRMPSSA